MQRSYRRLNSFCSTVGKRYQTSTRPRFLSLRHDTERYIYIPTGIGSIDRCYPKLIPCIGHKIRLFPHHKHEYSYRRGSSGVCHDITLCIIYCVSSFIFVFGKRVVASTMKLSTVSVVTSLLYSTANLGVVVVDAQRLRIRKNTVIDIPSSTTKNVPSSGGEPEDRLVTALMMEEDEECYSQSRRFRMCVNNITFSFSFI